MRKIKYFFVSFLCVITIFLSSITAFANGKVVKIGYIDYENFIEKNQDDLYEGYGVEYLNEISKYTKWNYEYVYDTWDTILSKLLTGEIDFVAQAQKTEEREKNYSFSKYSIGQESSILYVKSNNYNYYYEDFSNFNGMKVAYLKDAFQKDSFIEYAREKKFTYQGFDCLNNEECFELLEAGTVDAVATGSLSLKSGYRAIAKYASDPFYLMCGKLEKQRLLLNDVNNAIAQIKANNPLFEGSLFEKYYSMEIASNDISYTREEKNLIDSKQVIDIAYIPNRMPFSYMNGNNEIDGIVEDIMTSISEKSGLRFNYKMMPSGVSTIDYLKENPNSFVSGISSENKAFREGYLLSQTYYTGDIALASLKGTAYNVDAPNRYYKIGVSKTNADLVEYLQAKHQEFEIVLLNSNEECADKVTAGSIDFFASNTMVIQNIIQKPKYKKLMILPSYLKEESMAVVSVVNEKNQLITSIIDKTIDTILYEEIEQYVLNQTLLTRYEYTFGDTLYEYRVPFLIITILVILNMVGLVGIIIFRHISYKKQEIVNLKLESAVLAANNANKTKSRFLAQISHEIRTPMNAIIGLVNLAKSDIQSQAKVDDYLDKINSSSKILLGIINDVLDMSAIEGGKIKIDVSEFDLKFVIKNITALFYQQSKMKGITFNCRIFHLVEEKVLGDELRLNQILLNVLSNAIKFTNVGGAVDLNIFQEESEDNTIFIRFEIIDNGCGMSKEMQQRLFLPFEQESAKTANQYGGSGLGLAISKNLVDLMHGTIEVESELNKGTHFTIRLPLKKVIDNMERTVLNFNKLKVLVVDDDLDSCKYCSKLLTNLAICHDYVTNAEEALEKMASADEEKTPYNLCIIDYEMPGMSGVDLTAKIGYIFGFNTTVIIISAYDINEVEKSGTISGADYFVSKPLFQSTLYNTLVKISNNTSINNVDEEIKYDFTGKRILVAEDVELNMEVIEKLLQKVNVTVVKANDGKEAIDKYMMNPSSFDLILLDINMPFINGYNVAKMIRSSKTENASTVKIFAMTANAFKDDVEEAFSSGMDGHISKPIDVKLLYKTLDEVLRGEKNE